MKKPVVFWWDGDQETHGDPCTYTLRVGYSHQPMGSHCSFSAAEALWLALMIQDWLLGRNAHQGYGASGFRMDVTKKNGSFHEIEVTFLKKGEAQLMDAYHDTVSLSRPEAWQFIEHVEKWDPSPSTPSSKGLSKP